MDLPRQLDRWAGSLGHHLLNRVRDAQQRLEDDIQKIEEAIATDPEKPPEDVQLPDLSQAPKRKIRKSTRITVFPKVIAIHLSRSMFDAASYSSKNLAKVQYTQRLRLGGLLNEHWYKLLGVVCHKGSHNSGHYESFRRNHLYQPFSTPDAFAAYAAASRGITPSTSVAPSPHIDAVPAPNGVTFTDQSSTSLSSISASSSQPESRPTTATSTPSQPTTPLAPSQTSDHNPTTPPSNQSKMFV